MKISAVIITKDEAEKIGRAIRSVSWADEVLVVDSGSTDETCRIAAGLGAKVVYNEWQGFSQQKNFAASIAENDWIFSLDADEEVSPELRDELLLLKDSLESSQWGGYRIPRLSFYMNRAVRHSGWYPDYQLRLYDRRCGRWKEVIIHESVELDAGKSYTYLKNDIYHFSVENAAHHHRMIGERYAPLAARKMFEGGKRASLLKLAIAGPAAFFGSYFLKRGFIDGLPGFVISKFAAHHAFLKHLILWELQNAPEDVGIQRD